jgi:hypothetical protein
MKARALICRAECDENIIMVCSEEILALLSQYPNLRTSLIRLALDRNRPRCSLIRGENVDATSVAEGNRGDVPATRKLCCYKILTSNACEHRRNTRRAWISHTVSFLWHRFKSAD